MRSKLILAAAALAALSLAASAVAGNGGLGPVTPESPNAERIDQAYWFITIFVLLVLVVVEALLVLFIVKYRRGRRNADADGAQIHGSTRLETLWTAAPVVILLVIAGFVFAKLPGIRNVPDNTNLTVQVEGRQFYWQFTYPNGVVAVDRLRAPVGQPVELKVTAPEWDVIHSWWIPALGGKFDAIPGRVNTTWFEANREGVFEGRCAELCGVQHSAMDAAVEVMSVEAFEAWLAERAEAQRLAAAEPLGEETYEAACATCHGLDGEGGVAVGAPRLAGSAAVSNAESVENIVRNGRNLMPGVGRDWSASQMTALTSYLEERFANGG